MTIDRRKFLATTGALAGAALLPGCSTIGGTQNGFVTREGMKLMRDGTPYRIVGANMWYAAWLGADAPYGNRARLTRELDRLQAAGINNLRIMASGEEGPLKNSIKPGFTKEDGTDNAAQFDAE